MKLYIHAGYFQGIFMTSFQTSGSTTWPNQRIIQIIIRVSFYFVFIFTFFFVCQFYSFCCLEFGSDVFSLFVCPLLLSLDEFIPSDPCKQQESGRISWSRFCAASGPYGCRFSPVTKYGTIPHGSGVLFVVHWKRKTQLGRW